MVEPTCCITMRTDASSLGWGAVCQGSRAEGHWNKDERQAHINLLELKVAYFVIQSYMNIRSLTGINFLLQMDNSTAVANINKRGGTKSNQVTQIDLHIWNLCQSQTITLFAQHLSGT